MSRHLAIFSKKEDVERILRGEKTVEVRLSQDKIPPYGQVKKEDEILLKAASGRILGRVSVENVLYYDNLDPEKIARLRKEYYTEVGMPEDFWNKKANFVSLIFLRKPKRFLTPLKSKKKDRRGWMVLP